MGSHYLYDVTPCQRRPTVILDPRYNYAKFRTHQRRVVETKCTKVRAIAILLVSFSKASSNEKEGNGCR